MKDSLDKIAQVAGSVVDGAAKITSKIVDRGKEKVDRYTLENRVTKLQQQLGALVYTQYKNEGEEDEGMRQWYLSELDRVKMEISQVGKPEKTVTKTDFCPDCGAGVKGDAMFCHSCGKELS